MVFVNSKDKIEKVELSSCNRLLLRANYQKVRKLEIKYMLLQLYHEILTEIRNIPSLANCNGYSYVKTEFFNNS